jgi:hypothetical protein
MVVIHSRTDSSSCGVASKCLSSEYSAGTVPVRAIIVWGRGGDVRRLMYHCGSRNPSDCTRHEVTTHTRRKSHAASLFALVHVGIPRCLDVRLSRPGASAQRLRRDVHISCQCQCLRVACQWHAIAGRKVVENVSTDLDEIAGYFSRALDQSFKKL